MCRIVGWLCIDKSKRVDKHVLRLMRDSMFLGGPDGAGIWLDSSRSIGLAHRRLSILDLTQTGSQPMSSASGRFTVTYNGEIYNFEEIRAELSALGIRFEGRSDTEVLVNAFEVLGVDCVKRFHGMFAFAIWDNIDNKLTLVRDRIGVKPLYYARQEGNFYFSSELKGIMSNPRFVRRIDPKAMELFLKFSYVPSPYCILEDCKKLEPGSWLTIDSDNIIETGRWWAPETSEVTEFNWKDDQAVKAELINRLKISAEYRLVSDVPVGMFFSGGIDSSLLLAIIRKELGRDISTFTIGFDEGEYNEAHHAKRVANYLGSEHHELYLSPNTGIDLIDELPQIWDEPFGDSSAIATHLVSKFAKEKVKVALSADGGDELFCGYPKYWLSINRAANIDRHRLLTSLISLSPDRFLEFAGRSGIGNKFLKIKEIKKSTLPLMNSTFMLSQHVYSNFQIERLLKRSTLSLSEQILNMPTSSGGVSDVKAMLVQDLQTYHSDDIHVKVDRASMANSLEAREPLLDQMVVEFALGMPDRYKIDGTNPDTSKKLLREVLSDYVPQELTQRPKMGFGVPLDHWLNNELEPLVRRVLDPIKLEEEGIFNSQYVMQLLSAFKRNPKREVNKIWNLVVLQRWKEHWIDR